jgi:hypothetical protein
MLPHKIRRLNGIGEDALQEAAAPRSHKEMPQPFNITIPCSGILHTEKGDLMSVLEPSIYLVGPHPGPSISKGTSRAFIDELENLHNCIEDILQALCVIPEIKSLMKFPSSKGEILKGISNSKHSASLRASRCIAATLS